MTTAIIRTPAETTYGLPLPHRRMEHWKWTDLRQLVDRPYPPRFDVVAKPADIDRLAAASPFAALPATRMVFVNGHYDAKRSRLANGDAVSRQTGDEPVTQLNAAFATDGARLTLPAGPDRAIELLFIATDAEPRTVAVRNVIEIAAGAAATLIETHLGEGAYLASSVTEIVLGDGAVLDRVKVEHEAPDALHLAHTYVTLGTSARLREFTLTSGARVNRQNGTYTFTGKHADVKIAGAYLLAGKQHADTRLVVDHAVPCCTSRELFKCVMDDSARGVFQGKVQVRRHAQKTDGKQSSHGLLLSAAAEFDAKPELEIFADDVVCGHGATCGELNDDHLFYLKSRGIPAPQAKALLIAAFVGEAFETIAHEAIRAALEGCAETWLVAHGKSA